MMGSGGMIVMDRRGLRGGRFPLLSKFLEEESCGKCLPCRLGIKGMKELLDQFSERARREKDR